MKFQKGRAKHALRRIGALLLLALLAGCAVRAGKSPEDPAAAPETEGVPDDAFSAAAEIGWTIGARKKNGHTGRWLPLCVRSGFSE